MANLDPLHHFLDPLLDSIVFFLPRSIFINFYVLWPVFIKHGKEALGGGGGGGGEEPFQLFSIFTKVIPLLDETQTL